MPPVTSSIMMYMALEGIISTQIALNTFTVDIQNNSKQFPPFTEMKVVLKMEIYFCFAQKHKEIFG